jgi:antibiotic biosynthesis monooxygenase (ABM) superfamily enzyme
MIHVAVTRTVREGREQEFEAKIAGFFAATAKEPGTGGAFLIRRLEDDHPREYGILRSFEDEAAEARFYRSPVYRAWSDAVSPLVEGEPMKRELHGLEAFFRNGSEHPPAAWKMALLTWVAVNPAVFVSARLVPMLFGSLPGLIELLVVNVLVVATLTWGLMPLLTRLAAPWLRRG